jgi:hypothetical protein
VRLLEQVFETPLISYSDASRPLLKEGCGWFGLLRSNSLLARLCHVAFFSLGLMDWDSFVET